MLCVHFKGEKREKEKLIKLMCGSLTQVVKHLGEYHQCDEKRLECELHVTKKKRMGVV